MNGGNRMREMKDSGIEWIGKIPKEWVIGRLKIVADCMDSKRKPLNSSQRANIKGKIPYWGANSIQDYINDYLIDEEVVLLGEDGSPFFDKKKNVAFYSNEKIWPNNHIHVLKPKTNVDANFLVHWLNTVNYHDYVDGSTRDKLTQSSMMNIRVPILSLEVQKNIANFLEHKTSKIDSLISSKEKQIELLNEYKQSLISETVTKGLSPDVKMKDSGVEWIGEIPEHWIVVKSKQVLSFPTGELINPEFLNKDGKGVPYVRSTDFIESGKDPLYFDGDVSNCVYAEKGEYLISFRGYNKSWDDAILGLVSNLSYGVLSANVHRIISKNDLIIKRYGEFYMQSGFVRNLIIANAVGSISLFSMRYVPNLPVVLPSIKEQQQIVEFLEHKTSQIDTLIQNFQKEIDKLKEYKQSLIFEAVTGKIEVRDDL